MKSNRNCDTTVPAVFILLVLVWSWLPIGPLVNTVTLAIDGKADKIGDMWLDYVETNPVLGPTAAGIHAVAGNSDEANRVIKKVGNSVLDTAGSTPIVGHITSGICAAVGEQELAVKYAKEASRSTVVLASAVGAAALTGGVGAIPVLIGAGAAVGGGAAMDGVTYGIDYAVNGEEAELPGFVGQCADIHEKVQNGEMCVTEITNASMRVAVEGLCSAKVGKKLLDKGKQKIQESRNKGEVKSYDKMLDKAVDKAHADNPSTSKKQVRENLDRGIEGTSKLGEEGIGLKGDAVKPNRGPVHCRMEDANGNSGSGLSQSGREIRNIDKYKAGNSKYGKSSEAKSAAKLADSRMKQDNPQVVPKCGRASTTCGEHEAYDNLPEGAKPVTSVAFRKTRDGSVYGAERCADCKQANLGATPTDHLHAQRLNPPVPALVPNVPMAGGAIGGLVVVQLEGNRQKDA